MGYRDKIYSVSQDSEDCYLSLFGGIIRQAIIDYQKYRNIINKYKKQYKKLSTLNKNNSVNLKLSQLRQHIYIYDSAYTFLFCEDRLKMYIKYFNLEESVSIDYIRRIAQTVNLIGKSQEKKEDKENEYQSEFDSVIG